MIKYFNYETFLKIINIKYNLNISKNTLNM